LPAADRPATGLDNPAEYYDFGDRGRLLSCDSTESVVETRPERHLRWLQEANSDPCAGVSNEIDDLDQDILQPPRSQILAVAHANQQAFQRAYIEESGVTSDTAISILGWDTQHNGLSSSSRLPLQQPGVSVNNKTTDPVIYLVQCKSRRVPTLLPKCQPNLSYGLVVISDFRVIQFPCDEVNQ